jgi:hypothetical protein
VGGRRAVVGIPGLLDHPDRSHLPAQTLDRATATVSGMSPRWRWAFVLVVVVAALGVFMPKLLVTDSSVSNRTVVASLSEHPVAPTGCVSSSCNRGVPTQLILTGKSVLEWAVLLGVLAYVPLRNTKRFSLKRAALPRGIAVVLFHPPQSS